MYTNLLTSIKNAQDAGKEKLKAPYSEMDMSIANILLANKFIEGAEKKGRLPKRYLEITLRYDSDRKGVIRGVRFVSTPSRRIYLGYRDLKPVKQGFGISVVTTPEGVISAKEAKAKKVGGQVLFEIW